jgi:peptide chain release factor subunit 1
MPSAGAAPTGLQRELVRTLSEWDGGSAPITSLYLSVDGRRFPRKQDYELRLAEELRRARDLAESLDLDREAGRSVEADCAAIASFVHERFERGATRGLAVFSSSAAGRWEVIALPRPVRNQTTIGAQADILQLEALLDTYPTTCTALADFKTARLFLASLGRIEEVTEVSDDVPGRHDQGGWAQMRLQRHVDDHRRSHLKHVADTLLRLHDRRRFDHLILAGTTEVVAELERELHDYVARTVRARVVLPIGTSEAEVLERSVALDEELELERERDAVARLRAGTSKGGAVAGLDDVLGALWEDRVASLLVDGELHRPGSACPACGRLTPGTGSCPACGSRTRRVADVVEAGVATAVRHGCDVEMVTHDGLLADAGGVGAFLRF